MDSYMNYHISMTFINMRGNLLNLDIFVYGLKTHYDN